MDSNAYGEWLSEELCFLLEVGQVQIPSCSWRRKPEWISHSSVPTRQCDWSDALCLCRIESHGVRSNQSAWWKSNPHDEGSSSTSTTLRVVCLFKIFWDQPGCHQHQLQFLVSFLCHPVFCVTGGKKGIVNFGGGSALSHQGIIVRTVLHIKHLAWTRTILGKPKGKPVQKAASYECVLFLLIILLNGAHQWNRLWAAVESLLFVFRRQNADNPVCKSLFFWLNFLFQPVTKALSASYFLQAAQVLQKKLHSVCSSKKVS